jgi:CheY-like chemotaxis protein
MPKMDGIQLANAIRSHKQFDNIKLMLLTSGSMKGDKDLANKAGFSAYHIKPVQIESLLHSILRVINNEPQSIAQTGEDTIMHNNQLAADEAQEIQFKGHVLLSEDNLVNQKVAVKVLSLLELDIDIANDGLEAIAMHNQHQYDLIFMDCLMPNLDGLETTRLIRAGTHHKDIPIIALTANALPEDEKRCKEAGMDDFVSKPFKKSDIVAVLNRWLLSKSDRTEE